MRQPFVNYIFYHKHSLFLFCDSRRKLRNNNMTVIRDEERETAGEVLDEYYCRQIILLYYFRQKLNQDVVRLVLRFRETLSRFYLHKDFTNDHIYFTIGLTKISNISDVFE